MLTRAVTGIMPSESGRCVRMSGWAGGRPIDGAEGGDPLLARSASSDAEDGAEGGAGARSRSDDVVGERCRSSPMEKEVCVRVDAGLRSSFWSSPME